MNNVIRNVTRGIDVYEADYIVLNSNMMDDCSEYGININGVDNSTMSDNIMTNGGTAGMFWQNTNNCTFMGNRIMDYTTGIDGNDDWSDIDWNIVVGNNVKGCTNGIINIGTNSINQHNLE
jgi:parallel beta-helix repeat protein